MNFSDIEFIENGGRYGSPLGLNVRGYWVQKCLFDLMWQRASETLPTLDFSKKQTIVTIFGDRELWVSQKFGVRIALGRCLKYFADHGLLPIRVANLNKKGTRRYVRA